jgi:hypothetical protein
MRWLDPRCGLCGGYLGVVSEDLRSGWRIGREGEREEAWMGRRWMKSEQRRRGMNSEQRSRGRREEYQQDQVLAVEIRE